MSAGDAGVDAMLRKLSELQELPKQVAPEVAVAVRKSLEQQIAKGVDPSGKQWQPTQEGKKPLRNAGAQLKVTHVGTRIICLLVGHTARHNSGIARGGIVRRLLPQLKIPAEMQQLIREAVTREFKLIMGAQ